MCSQIDGDSQHFLPLLESVVRVPNRPLPFHLFPLHLENLLYQLSDCSLIQFLNPSPPFSCGGWGTKFKWECERLWVSNLVTGPFSLALESWHWPYWYKFIKVLYNGDLVKICNTNNLLCTWRGRWGSSLFLAEGQNQCPIYSKPTYDACCSLWFLSSQ